MLKIIGFTLGGILAIVILLLVLIFLALFPRLGLDVFIQNGVIKGTIRYGWIKFHIPQFKKKEQEPQLLLQEKQHQDVFQEKKESLWKHLEVGDLIEEGLSFLEDVKDQLQIDKLCVDAVLVTQNAAKTGLYLGALSALSGLIYPFLMQNFEIKEFHIRLDADFEQNKTNYKIQIAIYFRPILMLGPVLKHGLHFYRILKKSNNDGGKIV